MMRLRRHPTSRRLSRWADEANHVDDPDVIRHLGGCARCRREVGFLRELGEAARAITPPSAPPDLLARILERRRAGERVLIPQAAPVLATRRLGFAGGTGVLALLALLAVLVLPSGEAGAGTSDLRFFPAAPQSGQETVVRYRPSSTLAGRPSLRLRGRYRSRDDRTVHGEVLGRYLEVALLPAEDGLYAGSLRIPASAVYVVFAVEDPSGDGIDANGGALWDLLVHDREGVPLFAALRQRFLVRQKREFPAALETARRMTELYPDRVEGWTIRLGLDLLLRPERADSLRDVYAERFREIEAAAFAEPSPPVDRIASLVKFAGRLDDSVAEAYWNDRLQRQAPAHATAALYRYRSALGAHGRTGEELLDWIEREWNARGPATRDLAFKGFQEAMRTGDDARILRWAARVERTMPWESNRVATMLLAEPATRRAGLERTTSRLGKLEGPEDRLRRPLDESVSEYERRRHAQARRLRAASARALLLEGNPEGALALIEPAAVEGYEREVFETLGQTRLAAGDTIGALAAWARNASDPSVDDDAVRPERTRIIGALAAADWNRMVSEARQEVDARILDALPSGRLEPGAGVETFEGTRVALDSLLVGKVTFIAFWVQGRSEDLPKLEALRDPMREAGIQLLVIALEPPSAGTVAVLDARAPTIPGYFGTDAQTLRTLRAYGAPLYRIVAADGRLLFADDDLQEAVRQAYALRRTEPLTS